MKILNHPNVMKVLDTIKNTGQSNPGKEKKIQDENDQEWDWTEMGIWKAHLVFELATGGDLFSYQESQGALSEDETKFIAYQLVLGLDHLHALKVAHRGRSFPHSSLSIPYSPIHPSTDANNQTSNSKTSFCTTETTSQESSLAISDSQQPSRQ